MVIVANTTTDVTSFNVTGLFPVTTYELTMVEVFQGGNVIATSQPRKCH